MILSHVFVEIGPEREARRALRALERALLLELHVREPVLFQRRLAVEVAVALFARELLGRAAVRVCPSDVLAQRFHAAVLAFAERALLQALCATSAKGVVVALEVQFEIGVPRKALAAARD